MDLFEPHLITKKEVRFSECLIQEPSSLQENFGDIFGGIIKSGQWGWLTNGSRLCITSLRTGQSISKFDFDASNGFGVCIITCVSEIQMPYLKDTLIAIGIQYADSPGGLVVLYSVEESTVICCIDLKHKITCCRFISNEVSQHTILQNMDGCLAVGTDGGSVLLVDLSLRNIIDVPASKEDAGISVVPCHIVDYSMSLLHLHRHFQHCQQEGVHFGIQLEVLENAEFIQSLLPIDLVLGLAVGLADGRLVLYDLTDMQVFYVAPPQERSSPLVKMSSMEPPDDPRPCVYIWAFHENYQNSTAVMHSLMYEKRVVTDEGFCYFENFQVSSVRLQLPLNCPKSVPIACQSITKAPSHGNEETISLCALVWKQEKELQTEILLFDINQWYKEEMPYAGDWREDPSYLASFVLPGFSCLDMYFDPNTISLFNSIQRPEEHFYPISLSFDSIGLEEKSCHHLNWPGIQNRVVNVLRSQGSLALLDPNPIFMEVLNARLLPQFCGLNYKATFSVKAKRETLLSVAIENNCNGLLKECAKNWSDGSHQGTSLNEGLSLSTLTDWLWSRASSIKERCNKLCKVLFDHSGYTLDQREKQELCYISKQLRTLADLSSDIISKYGENIPSDVLNTLESQGNSIRMASDYQEILLWLLNIGLLPEGSRLQRHREVELNLVPYPYESLHGFYEKRRAEFMRYSSRKARTCYLLFIDSFLEHSFKGNALRDSWQESGGDGLYPPRSVQAMLRIMLIPDVLFENKCALFLYFFLDLNMAIEDKRYEPIVQNFIKFPSVFKLSASLIKQIQAFWNLDHCHFQAAVDEFISPFNKDHVCPQWQIELFIASLLNQIESNLALRVLEAKSLPISPILQLNTYLANDLISEAFHFARSENDEELLKLFFSRCLLMKKFGVIRDLALTDSEGKLVQSLLKNSKNRSAEDLSFVYLLQKYKYIEAVAYQDELSKGRDMQRSVDELSKSRNNPTAMDIDTATLVLSAYHTTMTPVTKNISDVYLKINKRIKNKETEQNSPYPLSCQLIKQNASDLLGGIYHSSALGTHFASHYWDQQKAEGGNALQQSTNAPFLRSPQISLSFSEYNPKDTISYPEPFKAAQKRRLDNSPVDPDKTSKIRDNPKKRRKIYDRYDFELSTSDNLLTHFKNSTSYNQDVGSLKKIHPQKTPSRDSSLFLETPYVENNPADNSRYQMPQKEVATLPGILKVSQPKTSIDETDHVRGASEELEKKKESEEEKSIRFTLPVDESLEQINEEDVSVENENVLKKSVDNLQQQPRSYSGPASRKSLRSTINYSSLLPMSKNELQDILDKVKNEQNKPGLLGSVKSTNIFESSTSTSKLSSRDVSPKLSDVSQVTEPKPSEDIDDDAKNNQQSQQERRTGPEARKSLITTTNYSSYTPISKNDLQDILDKVRSEQPKLDSVLKTTSIFESSTSVLTSTSKADSLNPPDPKKNLEFHANIDQQKHFTSFSSKSETITTSFGFPNVPSTESEPKLVSMDFTANKPEKQLEKPNISQFECLSNLDSYQSSKSISSKRALSESSESNSSDSVQRKSKQFRGRASIHRSVGDVSTEKTETVALEVEKIPTSILQETRAVFSTDTIIDFKPHTSSSKVCTTESKFNKVCLQPPRADSKSYSEKSPSKVTFSEQTTVIGELTYLPTMELSQNVTEASTTITMTANEKEQMLDTTVGMSLYDTMGFEENPLEHQPTSENSCSTDTFDNIDEDVDDQEDESELNNLNVDGKTSENGDSGSSIILLSSRSSSRAVSGSEDYKSPEFETNEITQRHISIDDEDDDDDEDNYFDENYDDNDDVEEDNDSNEEEEEEDLDESVEIIESDGSGDLSNSFSNKIREVTSTSTSSSLASLPISENSSHSGVLLQETIKAKNYSDSSNSESLTSSKKFKKSDSNQQTEKDEEEKALNVSKNTSEPELKLCVTSESITEQETIDVTIDDDANTTNKNSVQDRPAEESMAIEQNDDQNIKTVDTNIQIKVQCVTEQETIDVTIDDDANTVNKNSIQDRPAEESMAIEQNDAQNIKIVDTNIQIKVQCVTEQETIDVTIDDDANTVNKNSIQDRPAEESMAIEQNDAQNIKIVDTDIQIKVQSVESLAQKTEKEGGHSENVDIRAEEFSLVVQENEKRMDMDESVVLIEQIQAKKPDQDQLISECSESHAQREENVTNANEQPRSKEKESSSLMDDPKNNRRIDQEVDIEICEPKTNEKESIAIKIDSIEESEFRKDEPVENIESDVVEIVVSSQEVEEIQIVEAESTVGAEKSITNKDEENKEIVMEEKESAQKLPPSENLTNEKDVASESTLNATLTETKPDSVDDKKKQNLTKDEEEYTPKLRSTSIPKDLIDSSVASPRTRRLSRSGSMPPTRSTTEVDSSINRDKTISNAESLDEAKQKPSIEDTDHTPRPRNRRSTSFSKSITSETDVAASPSTRRLSRGGSVPPATGHQIVTRRRSLLLETLDETSTPDSPSSRTRSKIRSDSIDDLDADSPSVANVKRSRRSSITSITSIDQPQTPKTRRRSSMSVDKELVSTPKVAATPRASSLVKTMATDVTKTPVRTPRRLSVSKKESPPDDTSPTSSKAKSQKREEKSASKSPQIEPPETSQTDDYTLSRRLTRTQLAAMERNLALSKQPPVMSPVIKRRRGSNTTDHESPPDVKGSDNESNSSRMSYISNSTTGRRVTRSLALRESIADDKASIASSTESSKRKRKRVKDQISPIAALKVIPEEVPSGSEGSVHNSETGKRPTRHKK